MRVKSDMLTPSEVLQTDRKTISKIIDILFFDLDYSNYFFHPDGPEVTHIVADFDISEQNENMVISHTGELFKEEEVYPLFSAGMLIELLSLHHAFQLQTFGANWILLWDSQIVKSSLPDESLTYFLWRSLVELVKADKLVW